jgi:hypothetical protein
MRVHFPPAPLPFPVEKDGPPVASFLGRWPSSPSCTTPETICEEGFYPRITGIHGQVEKAGKGEGIQEQGEPLISYGLYLLHKLPYDALKLSTFHWTHPQLSFFSRPDTLLWSGHRFLEPSGEAVPAP